MNSSSGSLLAQPCLVWAHAEYLKLCRSLADGRVFDMPPQTAERYLLMQEQSTTSIWAFNHKIRKLPQGNTLRLFLPAPARVRWSATEWTTEKEHKTNNNTLGIHLVNLPTRHLAGGTTVRFTIYWIKENRWEGTEYFVEIA